MNLVIEFARKFGAEIEIDKKFVFRNEDKLFLLNDKLVEFVKTDFIYAGIYLGKIKDGQFFPSFNLLKIIAEKKEANKVLVDKKSEWLFICGRDVFKRGITKVFGSVTRGSYVLVLNKNNECLGFGEIVKDLGTIKKGVAVKNILDVGDFLRREKAKQANPL
ncbi:MAG: hypothetical protein QXM86_04740 [Candidatus Bathyarchaeia archaeon]